MKRVMTASKDDFLLNRPRSKKQRFIDLDKDNDSSTKSPLRSQSIIHIFKDDSELKKRAGLVL
jgi:hypothetical protein